MAVTVIRGMDHSAAATAVECTPEPPATSRDEPSSAQLRPGTHGSMQSHNGQAGRCAEGLDPHAFDDISRGVPMSDFKLQRSFASLTLCVSLLAMPACGGSLTRAHDALAVGNDDEAEGQLRKAVRSNSTKAEASILLAALLSRRGDKLAADQPKDAEAMYREALALDPRNEASRTGLARLLIKRGFMQEATELLSFKGCSSCHRLVGIMTHQKAENAMATGDALAARALYEQAFKEGNDPLDALAVARTYLNPALRDLDQAMTWLSAAAPLIAGGQVQAEAQFQELRVQLLVAAAEARDNDRVEQLFKIKTYVLQDEPEFDLRFRISQEQFRSGDSDPAIERVTNLLTNYAQYIDPTQRQVWEAALVIMYGARAAQYLQAGDAVGAAKDIAAGLKIDPENARLRMQQVLAIAANRLPLAFTEFEKLPKSKDKGEIEAILYALRCIEEVEEGKLAKAYDSLAKAQQLGPDLPEVYVARAYVLAESRNEDIKKAADLRDVRKLSEFSYPQARINQYPSALAYLDLAKRRVRAQGVLHPFRGPGYETRVSELHDRIKAFYPYEVSYYASGGGMIELVSEDGQKTAEYTGPRWLKGSAVASPGFPAEIPVKAPGIVYLTIDGKQIAIVVEEGTQITVNLGSGGATAPAPAVPAPAPAAPAEDAAAATPPPAPADDGLPD